jgi:hypothetical protein
MVCCSTVILKFINVNRYYGFLELSGGFETEAVKGGQWRNPWKKEKCFVALAGRKKYRPTIGTADFAD